MVSYTLQRPAPNCRHRTTGNTAVIRAYLFFNHLYQQELNKAGAQVHDYFAANTAMTVGPICYRAAKVVVTPASSNHAVCCR